MVLETISALFTTLNTAAGTTKVFKELLPNHRGDSRLLLEELKRNATLCWLVVEREAEPATAITRLATTAYDRLLEKDFDFNRLSPRKKKLARLSRFQDSDLASFLGNDVARLVESIYDRIKEVQLVYQVDPDNQKIDWNRRVINIHKRILLLMSHLQGWSERP
jgi:hypothetical protein